MTVIKMRGSWSKDELPHIGITAPLANYMAGHRLTRLPIAAILECDEVRDPTHGAKQVVFRIVALEPMLAEDGTDVGGRGDQLTALINDGRRLRQLAPVEETLFDHLNRADRDDEDRPDGDREMDGQQEIRLGPDGPREVPEASGEELMAEREEAKAKS